MKPRLGGRRRLSRFSPRRRRNKVVKAVVDMAHGITPAQARFLASNDFLRSPHYKRWRYRVFLEHGGRCVVCGRTAHDGIRLNPDHIYPRLHWPHLALEPTNGQPLCEDENAGKGNLDNTDWRKDPPKIVLSEEGARALRSVLLWWD